MTDLHERLAALRRERGYSLREMQRRIEEQTGERVAISYLSKLERGQVTPRIDTLCRIAAGYGVSPKALLGEATDDLLCEAAGRVIEAFWHDPDVVDAMSPATAAAVAALEWALALHLGDEDGSAAPT